MFLCLQLHLYYTVIIAVTSIQLKLELLLIFQARDTLDLSVMSCQYFFFVPGLNLEVVVRFKCLVDN